MTHAQPTQSRIILRQTHNWLKQNNRKIAEISNNKFSAQESYWLAAPPCFPDLRLA